MLGPIQPPEIGQSRWCLSSEDFTTATNEMPHETAMAANR